MENKKGILVVSFGTSFPDTRKKTIEAIEKDLAAEYPDRSFYRAWTSGFIRNKVKEKEGEIILSPEEALIQMAEDGIKDALIIPTHLLDGEEYQRLKATVSEHAASFDSAYMSAPLLCEKGDVEKTAPVIEAIYPERNADEMLVLMGHGSGKTKFPVYELLNEQFIKDGAADVVCGTVEFEPGIEPVIQRVRERKPGKVYLAPLLIVAGDHATNDMAGDEEDSWKNQIAREGTQVECILKGLGEYPEIRHLYIRCAQQTEKI